MLTEQKTRVTHGVGGGGGGVSNKTPATDASVLHTITHGWTLSGQPVSFQSKRLLLCPSTPSGDVTQAEAKAKTINPPGAVKPTAAPPTPPSGGRWG